MLYNIKNILGGGSVKIRANTQSIRYRVKQNHIIINILNRVNGKLYNQHPIAQFYATCALKNIIPIQSPQLINKQSAYLSGIMDCNGSITIGVSKTSLANYILSGVEGKIQRLIYSRDNHQLTLKINSIDKASIEVFKKSYGLGERREPHF